MVLGVVDEYDGVGDLRRRLRLAEARTKMKTKMLEISGDVDFSGGEDLRRCLRSSDAVE